MCPKMDELSEDHFSRLDDESKIKLSRMSKKYNAFFHSARETKAWQGMQVIVRTERIDLDGFELLITKYPNILKDIDKYNNISGVAWNSKSVNRVALIRLLLQHYPEHFIDEDTAVRRVQTLAGEKPIDIELIDLLFQKYPSMLNNLGNYEMIWDASWATKSDNKHILIQKLMHYNPEFAKMQQMVMVNINKIYPVYESKFDNQYTDYPDSKVFIIPFRRLKLICGNRRNHHFRTLDAVLQYLHWKRKNVNLFFELHTQESISVHERFARYIFDLVLAEEIRQQAKDEMEILIDRLCGQKTFNSIVTQETLVESHQLGLPYPFWTITVTQADTESHYEDPWE